MPTCKHDGKTYKCQGLSQTDVNMFHSSFYANKTKVKQDAFVVNYIKVNKPVRSRQVKTNSTRKGVAVSYYVRSTSTKHCKRVCQKTFINIVCISKDRIQRIARFFNYTGQLPTENRGGDRRSKKEVHANVRRFIESLKGIETHYCRSKTTHRVYLSSDLNITKLLRLYNKTFPENQVKRTLFRKIFCTEYNIGFGCPATDACSTCLSLTERLKRSASETVKNSLMIEKRVHKLKAKSFYKKLQEERADRKILSFDCQKNLANPKVPDQSAYFSRQLNTYNFTIIEGSSKCRITPANTFIYTWMEHEHCKSSNEIASALFHCLQNLNYSQIKEIRLMADGCGGQNRNSIAIGMIAYWFAEKAPAGIKQIEMIFPITGHSFLPPDRVFGNIERVLKKTSTVVNPKLYEEIFSQFGTVTNLKEINVRDWRSATTSVLKPTTAWHFKFNQMKRFILTKGRTGIIKVRGEPHYNSDCGQGQSILKRGKQISMLSQAEVIPPGVPVNETKLRDVNRLLEKHFGKNWSEDSDLSFFKDLLRHPVVSGDQHEQECEAIDETSDNLRI